ncbi:unnamed protein product [Cuscuta europaea]|uniref:Uncharacterized protein n=1 Tax=Cuscuta europaea TaxID=41803 RepID=A0A9P1DY93_CUSEU|nr:unnamed protein product [Cuscuta europaea]
MLDASIKKLADQLIKFPEAVLLAEELLESLKDAVPLRLPPYLHYLERHRSAALGFWFAPVIILHLIKELKEDLKNVLADNYFEDSVEYTDLFVKEKKIHLVSGEERSMNEMCMESPSCSTALIIWKKQTIRIMHTLIIFFPKKRR